MIRLFRHIPSLHYKYLNYFACPSSTPRDEAPRYMLRSSPASCKCLQCAAAQSALSTPFKYLLLLRPTANTAVRPLTHGVKIQSKQPAMPFFMEFASTARQQVQPESRQNNAKMQFTKHECRTARRTEVQRGYQSNSVLHLWSMPPLATAPRCLLPSPIVPTVTNTIHKNDIAEEPSESYHMGIYTRFIYNQCRLASPSKP